MGVFKLYKWYQIVQHTTLKELSRFKSPIRSNRTKNPEQKNKTDKQK